MKATNMNYYINTITGPELVSGIVVDVDGHKLGIHKHEGLWIVDDILTGAYLRMFDTRKAAKAWIEENLDAIKKIPKKNIYAKRVKEFESECKKLS